jgi:hypothetical protein
MSVKIPAPEYSETAREYLARLEALQASVESALANTGDDDEREALATTWDGLSDEIAELRDEIEDRESYGAMRDRVRGRG